MLESPQKLPVSVDPARLRLDKDQAATGALVGMRCMDCGIYVFGQAVFCQACSSARLEEAELSRTGTLYSYTIVRVPPDGWPGPVPYVLGEVELPEGPHILAEIVEVAHEQLKIGMEMGLALREAQSSESGPIFMVYKWAPLTDSTVGEEEA